jgi:transposase
MAMHPKRLTERIKDIEDFLLQEYKNNKEEKKRDWRTYEQRLSKRIKEAIRNLEPLIDEATASIKVHREKGRRPTLSLKQKVILLLLQRLFAKSNRNMTYMIDAFSLLSGVDISYKTVERLYSDPEVEMAIHNLHILILKKKGVKNIDATGDGTGYSLSIREHYASEVEKRKDEAKESGDKGKMAFVYSFKMLDLNSKMYIAYGVSMKSEKRAFDRAMEMIDESHLSIDSVRLDRYYSFPSYVDRFGKDTNVYIIPRKNATLKGSWKWKRTMIEFVNNTLPYLGEYYKRENSESQFSVDKRWFGWKVEQRRWDRINTAIACTTLWHNMFNLYSN